MPSARITPTISIATPGINMAQKMTHAVAAVLTSTIPLPAALAPLPESPIGVLHLVRVACPCGVTTAHATPWLNLHDLAQSPRYERESVLRVQ